MLSILDIIEDTTVDGPGFRTSIYAAGCPVAITLNPGISTGDAGCRQTKFWRKCLPTILQT